MEVNIFLENFKILVLSKLHKINVKCYKILYPVNRKSYLKLFWGHIFFVLYPISKIFAALYATNLGLRIGEKIFYLFINQLNIVHALCQFSSSSG